MAGPERSNDLTFQFSRRYSPQFRNTITSWLLVYYHRGPAKTAGLTSLIPFGKLRGLSATVTRCLLPIRHLVFWNGRTLI